MREVSPETSPTKLSCSWHGKSSITSETFSPEQDKFGKKGKTESAKMYINISRKHSVREKTLANGNKNYSQNVLIRY